MDKQDFSVFSDILASPKEGLGLKMKTLTLPRLDRLSPTLESTALKLMEETGELAQAIGKFRGMNGEETTATDAEVRERIASELLDVAQTAVTMMFVMEERYGVHIESVVEKHVKKLEERRYLTK